MFIGHLPAGYLLTKKLQKKFRIHKYLWIGLIGSVFPDIDIIWFYLVDNRQNLHHGYWTHLPFDWLILTFITFLLLLLFKKKQYFFAAGVFFANVFLHFFLDTIVGKIEWLYPFSSQSFAFFEVPARYPFWIENFVFHWTFLFEIIVIIWALLEWRHERKKIPTKI